MYSIVSTAIIHGIQSVPISVEADVSDGLPVFEMVGFLASEVQEAKERVRTALKTAALPCLQSILRSILRLRISENPVPGLTFRLRWQSLPHSGISDRKWSGNIL